MPECEAPTCQTRIYFAYGEPKPGSGGQRSRMPVDLDSTDTTDERANLEVWRDPPRAEGERGLLRFRVLKRGEDVAEGRHRAMSHYVTCAEPERFRRVRAARVCKR